MKPPCVILLCLLASSATPQISNREAVEIAKGYVRAFHPAREFDYYRIGNAPPEQTNFRIQAGRQAPVFIELSATGEFVGYEDYSWDNHVAEGWPDKIRTDKEAWQALESCLRHVRVPPGLTFRVLKRGDSIVDEFSMRSHPDGQTTWGVNSVEAMMLKGESRIVRLWISRSGERPVASPPKEPGGNTGSGTASRSGPTAPILTLAIGAGAVLVAAGGVLLIRRARVRS